MRDEAKRYEGSTFATEKALATIYVIMFVLIVGVGVIKQMDRIMPESTSFASNEESTP